MKDKRALVTGGAGFIGSHVVRELCENGYIIDIVDDMSCGSLDSLEGISFRVVPIDLLKEFERKHSRNERAVGSALVIEGDFSHPFMLERTLNSYYDVIFHLAAQPRVQYSVENPYDTNETNVSKTLLLLQSIRNNGTKFVFSSSAAIYGNTEVLPTTEFSPSNPMSPYGLQKRMIEDYLTLFGKLYDQHSVCLRYFNVYGPGQDGSSPYSTAISAWCSAIKNNRPLRSDGDGYQTRDLVFVRDVARANRLAAESNHPFRGHALNIGYGQSLANVEILDELKKRFENIEIINAPERIGDVRDTLASIDIAKEVINWIPEFDFKTGLEETLRWWKL